MNKAKFKKVADAIFAIEDASNDAVANGDKTVTVDVKLAIALVDYAKQYACGKK